MTRILLVLALVCLPALAQYDIYTVPYATTLSGAATALSVQLPDTGSHQTEILEVTVGCSAQCQIRLERNGNAAVHNGTTITSATLVALNPESTPTALQTTPNVKAFYGSGIPSGTAVTPTWTLPAGAIMPFGGGRVLVGSGGGRNYIVRLVGQYTGDIQIFFAVKVRR